MFTEHLILDPQKRQLWLSRILFLSMLIATLFLPRYAQAALAVPMCSAFSECVVAPPVEAPPTGGEIRGEAYRDPRAPTLSLSTERAPEKVPWQVPGPELAVVVAFSVVRVASARATYQQPQQSSVRGPFGVRTPVFRPPCGS